MKLQSLQIKNYRNFVDSGLIPYHDLTIFVGENGSGKTSTIDALSLLIDHHAPKPTEDDVVDGVLPIEIEATFCVQPSDEERSIDRYCVNDCLTLLYSFDLSTGTTRYSAKCKRYIDDSLNTYKSLNANDLRALVIRLGITPGRTKSDSYGVIQSFLDSTSPDTEEGYVDVAWADIAAYLPIIQRYSSGDYSKPENIVSKTLTTIYRTHFYEVDEESGEERLKQSFGDLKADITTDLDNNINNQLKERLSRQLDSIASVGGDFDIDFARGFMLKGISITYDSGLRRTIDTLGEGHRKKATLAILEWDAEVSASIDGRSVIKAYDEPDANLDFPAQRKIFNIVNQDVQDNDHVSAIICTHSLTLIDRAPAESINRITLKDEKATVEYLNANEDDDIKQFLSQVAGISGLRNSNIFYEKAFLVVEGQSEEASIGTLYKTYTGTSMPEDGIVLINIETNGQWNNALKFLSANKSDCTLLLLDSDTQQLGSGTPVTPQKLLNAGFSQNFLNENCFFIGSKEFEDTYSDEDLAQMANNNYTRSDGREWVAADFSAIRIANKFSAELIKLMYEEHGSSVGKPEIAYKMAVLYDRAKISRNTVLSDLFDKLQEIVSG